MQQLQGKYKLDKGDMAEIARRVNALRSEILKREVSYGHVRYVLLGKREMSADIALVTDIYMEEKESRPKLDMVEVAKRQQAARMAAQ